MNLCPIAIVAGCAKCPAFSICPLRGPVGPVVLALVLVESLVAFAWLLHVGQKVSLGAPSPAATVHSDPPAAMSVALVVLMIGCLVVPAVAMPLVLGLVR